MYRNAFRSCIIAQASCNAPASRQSQKGALHPRSRQERRALTAAAWRPSVCRAPLWPSLRARWVPQACERAHLAACSAIAAWLGAAGVAPAAGWPVHPSATYRACASTTALRRPPAVLGAAEPTAAARLQAEICMADCLLVIKEQPARKKLRQGGRWPLYLGRWGCEDEEPCSRESLASVIDQVVQCTNAFVARSKARRLSRPAARHRRREHRFALVARQPAQLRVVQDLHALQLQEKGRQGTGWSDERKAAVDPFVQQPVQCKKRLVRSRMPHMHTRAIPLAAALLRPPLQWLTVHRLASKFSIRCSRSSTRLASTPGAPAPPAAAAVPAARFCCCCCCWAAALLPGARSSALPSS